MLGGRLGSMVIIQASCAWAIPLSRRPVWRGLPVSIAALLPLSTALATVFCNPRAAAATVSPIRSPRLLRATNSPLRSAQYRCSSGCDGSSPGCSSPPCLAALAAPRLDVNFSACLRTSPWHYRGCSTRLASASSAVASRSTENVASPSSPLTRTTVVTFFIHAAPASGLHAHYFKYSTLLPPPRKVWCNIYQFGHVAGHPSGPAKDRDVA